MGQPISREEAMQALYTQHVNSGSVAVTPIFKAIVGFLMLFAMVAISCFSILTTQNLIEGGHGEGVRLSWAIVSQPLDVMNGMYTGKELVAVLASWALWILYVIFGALEVITPDNRPEDKAFKTFVYILLFVDGCATYNYLTIVAWWYQILFTLLVPLAIGFFGKKGLTLMLNAIHSFITGAKGKQNA
jgi:hypothetical protein